MLFFYELHYTSRFVLWREGIGGRSWGEEGGGIVPGEGGLFKEVESERRGGGLYTCMFIYLGKDTCSYFDIECRLYGCP